MKVKKDLVEEMRQLSQAGDIDLPAMRKQFNTTLSDDNLLAAVAASDDDDGEVLNQNIRTIEKEGVELI